MVEVAYNCITLIACIIKTDSKVSCGDSHIYIYIYIYIYGDFVSSFFLSNEKYITKNYDIYESQQLHKFHSL